MTGHRYLARASSGAVAFPQEGSRRSGVRTIVHLAGVMLMTAVLGCEQSTVRVEEDIPVAKAKPLPASPETPPMVTADELRRRLGTDERATFRRVGMEIVEVGLAGAGVKSIEPLKGLPLRKLDLGFCRNVDDISALAGMPLSTLILEGTSVADLSPLKGMQLKVLYLQDTPVTDLSVIQEMPLEQLNLKGVRVADVKPFASLPLSTIWLPGTDVRDISPLSKLSLESLDLQDTEVSELSALSHMTTLLRLNIAGTPITDIRPVTGLKLERIILSPETITRGMDELREIESLGQIWTSHEHRFSANDFWERYDVGAWSSETEDDPSSQQGKESADNGAEPSESVDASEASIQPDTSAEDASEEDRSEAPVRGDSE